MATGKKKMGRGGLSKRKAGSARKSKRLKTKISPHTFATSGATAVRAQPSHLQDRVVTSRQQRLIDRAMVRAELPVEEVIPEVRAVQITDVSGVVYDPEEYQAMVDMYDATIRDIREGEIVSGIVLGVSRNDVIVDVGFKSEGIIPLDEFPTPLNITVGETLDVYLEQIEDSNGQLILSKQKADFMKVWEKIREVHDAGDTITGKVARRIKGGLVVDIMGVDAFLPGSQVALRQVPDFDALIYQEMEVKIIKLNKSRRNVVVSRRIVLEEEREEMRNNLLSEIAVHQIRPGIVKNVTDFGVFIDLGGVDGLLHITDMSWGRIKHPSDMVSLGEKIDVKILDFDDRTSRISLGLKQMTPYPWENVEQKYPIGKQVRGRVVSITDYGAFVELEKGIEGLIHISEMSWTQHIKHPSKIMNVDDEIEAIVLSVDKEHEKISLGIKQLEPDPWATIDEKYPIGSEMSGKVRNLTAFGAFVELEDGIDGLVHISDMSWLKRIQHPSEIVRKGDNISIKILRIDHENRRISLGIKQLVDDPWPEIEQKYPVGSECLGTITKVLDRGVLVELDGKVEGFVPTAQLGLKEGESSTAGFKEGEEIPLQAVELIRNQHKIVLSVTAYYKKRDAAELEEFVSRHATATQSMADSIPDELKEAAKTSAKAEEVSEPAKSDESPSEEQAATEDAATATAEEPAKESSESTDSSEAVSDEADKKEEAEETKEESGN